MANKKGRIEILQSPVSFLFNHQIISQYIECFIKKKNKKKKTQTFYRKPLIKSQTFPHLHQRNFKN